MELNNLGILSSLKLSEVGITDGLILWYPLNGDLEDYTPNRNNGTVYGATIATGIDGKLLYDFDGTDDYIDCGTIDFSGMTSISFGLWFYVDTSFSAEKSVIRSQNTLQLGLMSESSVRNLLSTTGGTTGWTLANDFSYSFGLNAWNHMMYVWDGSTGKTYINGVLANTSTVTGSIVSTTYSLRIGNYNSTAYFPGKIQDVRIYDRLLTLQEVGIIYDLTKESLVAMKVTNTTTYVKSQFKEI